MFLLALQYSVPVIISDVYLDSPVDSYRSGLMEIFMKNKFVGGNEA